MTVANDKLTTLSCVENKIAKLDAGKEILTNSMMQETRFPIAQLKC